MLSRVYYKGSQQFQQSLLRGSVQTEGLGAILQCGLGITGDDWCLPLYSSSVTARPGGPTVYLTCPVHSTAVLQPYRLHPDPAWENG